MLDERDQIGCLVVIVVIVAVVLLIRKYMQYKKEQVRRYVQERHQAEAEARQQQQHVFNISSRVQGQEHRFPTGDAHLSLDQINILNELNKPIYDDAPPSYEEAMKIAIAVSNSTSSTSDATGTQQVVPAIPKRTD